MPKLPAAILFDHDGLLVETEVLFFGVTRDLLADRGIELTEALWADAYLSQGRRSTEIVRGLGLPQEILDRFVEERNRRYAELLRQDPPLCHHAGEVLAELGRAFPMGLVTGNSRSAIETVHRKTGLLRYFSQIITNEDFDRPKPFPYSYLRASERMRVPAGRCLAVEDSGRGLAAALAAGMRCIVVPGVLTRGQDFPGAEAVLPTLEGLPSAVRSSFAGPGRAHPGQEDA